MSFSSDLKRTRDRIVDPGRSVDRDWRLGRGVARDAISVLALNYPEHPALDENGNFESDFDLDGMHRSWINKLSFGLLDAPQPPQFDTTAEI